jgi:hypothetical protein
LRRSGRYLRGNENHTSRTAAYTLSVLFGEAVGILGPLASSIHFCFRQRPSSGLPHQPVSCSLKCTRMGGIPATNGSARGMTSTLVLFSLSRFYPVGEIGSLLEPHHSMTYRGTRPATSGMNAAYVFHFIKDGCS